MKTFGERIYEARREQGISPEVLAEEVGTCRTYIRLIENEKVNPPSVKLIPKICRALDLDIPTMIIVAVIQKAPEEIRESLWNRCAELFKED